MIAEERREKQLTFKTFWWTAHRCVDTGGRDKVWIHFAKERNAGGVMGSDHMAQIEFYLHGPDKDGPLRELAEVLVAVLNSSPEP